MKNDKFESYPDSVEKVLAARKTSDEHKGINGCPSIKNLCLQQVENLRLFVS